MPLLRFGKFRFTLAERNTIWPFYTQFFRNAYGCLNINGGDTVLDAGASVGFFSIYAASICKRVIAMEPGRESFTALSINRKLNRAMNIIPIRIALGNAVGHVRMTGNGVSRRVITSTAESNEGQSVPSTTIDQVLEELHCTVDVVKMDIEGSERSSLDGEYLRSVREIVVETHGTKDYVLDLLTSFGFSTEMIHFKTQELFLKILKHPLAFTHAALSTNLVETRSSMMTTMQQQIIVPHLGNEQVDLVYGKNLKCLRPVTA